MNYDDAMLEAYIYENQQLLEKLEGLMLRGEKGSALSHGDIDEVFRIMHTIKGASSMMSFDNLFQVTHSAEDLFSQIRDNGGECADWGDIFDIVLDTIDFVKREFAKIQAGLASDGDPRYLIRKIEEHLQRMRKQAPAPPAQNGSADPPSSNGLAEMSKHPCYKIKIMFEPDCKMENLRALGVVVALNKICSRLEHIPRDLDDDTACAYIAENGLTLYVRSEENPDRLKQLVDETLFVRNFSVIPLENDNEEIPESLRLPKPAAFGNGRSETSSSFPETSARQNFISVNVNKLDSLMDLVGELVTTESMVTRNPDLAGLHLNNF